MNKHHFLVQENPHTGTGTEEQEVKLQPEMSASLKEMVSSSPGYPKLLICSLLSTSERQQRTAHVLQFLPPTWETLLQLLTTGFLIRYGTSAFKTDLSLAFILSFK